MYINKLRKIRMEKGLTLEELAEKTNISIGYLSHLELGTRKNPSMKIMEKIASALNKNLIEIFFDNE